MFGEDMRVRLLFGDDRRVRLLFGENMSETVVW